MRFCLLLFSSVLASAAVLLGRLQAGELSSAEFEKLHEMIRRQPGESRWMEVEWHPNVWEARKKAAAEGKPLFLMAGSGGAPAAGC